MTCKEKLSTAIKAPEQGNYFELGLKQQYVIYLLL